MYFSFFSLFCYLFSLNSVWPCGDATANQLSGLSFHKHIKVFYSCSFTQKPLHALYGHLRWSKFSAKFVVLQRLVWWWVDCHHVEISFLSYRKALLKLKSSVVRRDWCASWKRAIKFYASVEQKKWTSTTKTWKLPKGPEWSNTRRSRREIRGLKEDEIKGRVMVKKKRCPLCLDCPCV